MNRHVFGWWLWARALVACLTSPRTDARANDADVRAAICASRLFSFVQSAVAVVEYAWADSHVRRVVAPIGSTALERPRGGRIRLAGACAAVAALTALLLQTAASEAGPLRWILPLTIGVVALSVAAAADPIARAWEAKRR